MGANSANDSSYVEIITAQEVQKILGIKESAFSRFRKNNPDFPKPLPGIGKRLFLKPAIVAFINAKCSMQIAG